MTSRLLARRPVRLGGLLLATTTLGLAAAPAALAEDAPVPQVGPGADDSATDDAAPLVLGPVAPTADTAGSAPQVAGTTTPTRAHFGTGKLDLSLDDDADPLPSYARLNPSGAQLELRFSQVEGAPSTAVGTCTFVGSTCVFDAGSTLPTGDYGRGQVPRLPNFSEFTLTLLRPPTSDQLLDVPMAIQGWTDSRWNPAAMTSELALPVQHAYRTLGVAVVDGAPAGTQVELCPALDGACAADRTVTTATTDAAGLARFPEAYLPGDYLVTRAGTATPFTVPAATSQAERDTPLRLTLGVPVTAPPTTPPSPPSTSSAPGSATAAATTVAAGRQQTVTAGGFAPGETVRGTLYSTPVDLGTAVADAQGVATFTFTVPAGLEPGVHTVTAVGLTSGATSTVTFTVTAGATLATTGADVGPLLGLGALAVGAGAALAVAGSRSRRTA
ncbi:hypothetical protein TEK04_16210 [Klenkia sp. LSe6-5]|uniref:Ig-like domain (Group 3) n=1 Tax=Klenkia sesuvii TaxID=3103137 RepID=A0ABU8DWQ4_9ACTN